MRQRHLRPFARRRPRHRARRVRAPRHAPTRPGRLVHARRGPPARRRSRPHPTPRSSRSPSRCATSNASTSTPSRRAPSRHGVSFAAGALDRARRRALRARRPRRRAARGLRAAAAPRCDPPSSSWPHERRGSDADRRRPRRALGRARRRAGTRGAVVTIGVYDGVHLGHHAVLRLVRELADARGLAAVCVTFDRHPAEVVRPESAPKLLTTPEQKLELLDATGYLDLAFVLHFDEARSQRAGRGLRARGAGRRPRTPGSWWSAPTSTSARAAAATSRCSSGWARARLRGVGVGLEAAPRRRPIYSSTRIRELLADGRRRGRRGAARPSARGARAPWSRATAGAASSAIPTANVAVPGRCCLPADGIYAGTVRGPPTASTGSPSISLGRRPTFYESADDVAARGLRARLRRRPLRPAGRGAVRRTGSGARSGSSRSRPWSSRSRSDVEATRRVLS